MRPFKSFSRKSAVRRNHERLLLIIGVVSLLADFVYESFRSVLYIIVKSGGLLNTCLIDGIGELTLSIARVLSPLAVKVFRLSTLYLLGYACAGFLVPAVVIPSLSYILYPLERFGKGLRTPSRDYLISSIPEKPGRKFSICELLDQSGAVLGPLIMLIMFSTTRSTDIIAISLALAYILCMITATYIYETYKKIEITAQRKHSHTVSQIPRTTILAIFIMALPLIFRTPLIMAQYLSSFKFYYREAEGIAIFLISTIFSIVFAYPIGRLIDKVKSRAMIIIPAACMLTFISLIKFQNYIIYSIVVGTVYGFTLAVCEIVPKAIVNYIISDSDARKFAYALLNAFIGVTYFIGNIIVPILYSYLKNLVLLVTISSLIDLTLAIALFMLSSRLL